MLRWPRNHVQCESNKVAPKKLFCSIFTRGTGKLPAIGVLPCMDHACGTHYLTVTVSESSNGC